MANRRGLCSSRTTKRSSRGEAPESSCKSTSLRSASCAALRARVARWTSRRRATGSATPSGNGSEKKESRLDAASTLVVEADRHAHLERPEPAVVALEPAPQGARDDRENRVVERRIVQRPGGVVQGLERDGGESDLAPCADRAVERRPTPAAGELPMHEAR